MIVSVRPAWWECAKLTVALDRYAHASDTRRLVLGFVAELAGQAALEEILGERVDWLSAKATQQQGDLRWRGLPIDVKLFRGEGEIPIKIGAEHTTHLILQRVMTPGTDAFRILGILLPYQPETFSAPEILRSSKGDEFVSLSDRRRAVHGWLIPQARLAHPKVLRSLCPT